MGDAVAALDADVLVRIGVEQRHDELPSVATVDEAGRVHDRKAVARREPAAGDDETGMSGRDGHGNSGRDKATTATGGDDDGGTGHEVKACVTRTGVGGQREIGVEARDGDEQRAGFGIGSWVASARAHASPMVGGDTPASLPVWKPGVPAAPG